MNIGALTALLAFQCLGEGLAYVLGLPVPGPVIGMLALLAAFFVFPTLSAAMEGTSWDILRHLSLLFVPAGVGVMASISQIDGGLLPIAVAILVSTVLSIAVTAVVTRYVQRRQQGGNVGTGEP